MDRVPGGQLVAKPCTSWCEGAVEADGEKKNSGYLWAPSGLLLVRLIPQSVQRKIMNFPLIRLTVHPAGFTSLGMSTLFGVFSPLSSPILNPERQHTCTLFTKASFQTSCGVPTPWFQFFTLLLLPLLPLRWSIYFVLQVNDQKDISRI